MGLVTPVDPVPVGELGKVHFVAIGGAGMSGIARIMLARGVTVSGSDSAASPLLDELAALGARVRVGHAAANLGDADTLVVSTAIRPDNPELVEAQRRGLRVLHRAAALASVMLGHQGDRGGRHARQDDDHVDDHHGAAAQRRRPVLRHRRDPGRDRARRGARAAARPSWWRPTRATARSSCSPRTRRS